MEKRENTKKKNMNPTKKNRPNPESEKSAKLEKSEISEQSGSTEKTEKLEGTENGEELQRMEWMVAPPKREKPLRNQEIMAEKPPETPDLIDTPYAAGLNSRKPDEESAKPKDFLVGDGGTRWRARARALARAAQDNPGAPGTTGAPPEKKNLPPRGDVRGTPRSWRKNTGIDGDSTRNQSFRGSRDRGDRDSSRDRSFNGDASSDRNVDRSARDRDRDYEKRGDQHSGAKKTPEDAEEEFPADMDLNELAAEAVKAQIMGDMEKCEKIKRQVEAAKNREKVVYLSDIAVDGRSKSASKREQEITKRGPHKDTHDNGKRKNYYKDDDVDFDELKKREKREGVEDYDANYANNIIKNSRYKDRSSKDPDLDDEIVDYGEWEKKTGKRKKTPQQIQEKERLKAINDYHHQTKKEEKMLFLFFK